MFASASASLASRVPVRLGERRGRSAAKVNTSARAATTYTLDGKGCAGARTGDTGEFKNNIVAYKKRDAPACPIKPIAVTELCASHEGGKFKMLDAIFEQVGDDLYIYGCKPDECVRDAALPRTARASSRQDDIFMAFPSGASRGRTSTACCCHAPVSRSRLGRNGFFRGSFFFFSSRVRRAPPRPASHAPPPSLTLLPSGSPPPPRPARRAAARTPPSTSRWTAAPSRPRRGRNCASSPGSSSASAGSASRSSATSSRTREAKKERPREREKRAREEGRARKDARGKPRARRGEREVSP